jgi:GPH family glycoside/pentoside/hexuronide:cation symporter
MCAAVVDHDELNSGKRREGAFNSWLSWVIEFGLAFALLASGLILEGTGFTALAGGAQAPETLWWIRFGLAAIPVTALTIAVVLLFMYPLSRARMHALRLELESKRGLV